MYDTIIIGGGIAGLYCAMNIKNHLLLECNDYLGGRIFTHKEPKYESGAGRYNENHILLVNIINKFKLTPIQLSNDQLYIEDSKYRTHIEKYFHKKMKKVLKNGSFDETFYQHCLHYYSKDEVDELRYIFGYTSEFLEMNAKDAIRMFKKKVGNYYIVKEGMSELVRRMSLHVNYKMKHCVTSVRENNGTFEVDGYACKKIIFAIPPDNIKQIAFLKSVHPLLKSLQTNCLLRIYAIYPNKWFAGLPNLTTNSFIRHIIPIDAEAGLVMISYVEGRDADVYLNSKGGLYKNVQSKIQTELKHMFPDKEIIEPTYFQPHVWKIGDHAWKPGYDSDKIAKELLNPMPNIYLCGEAFSHNQSWIEGALENATEVLDILEQGHNEHNT
jgi:protoporphyrinogen oxidase